MKTKIILLLFLVFFSSNSYAKKTAFIVKPADLKQFDDQKNVITIASTGRSGSSLLTRLIYNYVEEDFTVLKTHIHSISRGYKGKILFIFSNPDKSAESALHITLNSKEFGRAHFNNMQCSDKRWLMNLGETTNQTLKDNLLSYDALRCQSHLNEWLVKTIPCDPTMANILAVKYENLWDTETIENIKDFLQLRDFQMVPKKERGCSKNSLNEVELSFRQAYNLGTFENPEYKAYDGARNIWENAPAFQYLHTR